jgi:hypothetical protein
MLGKKSNILDRSAIQLRIRVVVVRTYKVMKSILKVKKLI